MRNVRILSFPSSIEFMGFLDNLENSLKSLESQGEQDSGEQRRREDEQSWTRAVAPWAEKLKTSPYTQDLLEQAAVVGHRLRTKIYIAWMGLSLHLEAKGRKLQLQPTPEGIVATMIEPNDTRTSMPVDLNGKPEDLLAQWLSPEKSNNVESYEKSN